MLKKIPVTSLRVGMYVHDLNCGWLDHPFLRNQLAIRDKKTLARVLRTGTKEVYIDTERGLDLPREHPAEIEVKTKQDIDKSLLEDLQRVIAAAPPKNLHVAVQEELKFASATAQEARKVISNVMHSLRAGRQFVLAEVEDVVGQLADSVLRNPHALMGLSRIREADQYTFEHSVSVAVFMLAFAREMKLDEKTVRDLGIGALLHDIGKTLIPDEILNKPAALTDEEFSIMRTHVDLGRDILEEHGGLSDISMAVVAEHHERHDGNGYPRRLKGDGITLYGQMAAIVDVYDANTAERVYHHGEIPTRVLALLLEWSANHFNPQLVQQFIRCVGIWPVGSLVLLGNGWLAVVVEQNESDLLHPRVRAIYDTGQLCFMPPVDLDLADPDKAEFRISGAVSEQAWKIRAADYLDAGRL